MQFWQDRISHIIESLSRFWPSNAKTANPEDSVTLSSYQCEHFIRFPVGSLKDHRIRNKIILTINMNKESSMGQFPELRNCQESASCTLQGFLLRHNQLNFPLCQQVHRQSCRTHFLGSLKRRLWIANPEMPNVCHAKRLFRSSEICKSIPYDMLHSVCEKWLTIIYYPRQLGQATTQRNWICQVTRQFPGVASFICSFLFFPL